MQHWRRNLYVSLAMVFVVQSCYTLVVPFMPYYLKSMNVTEGLAVWSGLASAATFLTSSLMSPIWGSLADKYGKKMQILRSGLGFSLMYALYPYARTPLQFVIMRAISGLFSGFIPAAVSLIASNTPEEDMSYALGTFQAFSAAGTISGPLIGGLLVRVGGIPTAFRLASVGLLFFTIIPYIILREETVRSQGRLNVLRDIKVCFTNPNLVAAFACLLLVQCGIQTTQPTLSLYVDKLAGGTQDSALLSGIVFSIAGLGTVVGASVAGKKGNAAGSYDHARLFLVGLLGSALFSALQGVWMNLIPLAAFRLLFGVFNGVLTVAGNVLIATAVSRDFRGRAFGVQSALSPLGSMAGPLLGGYVGDSLGLSSAFYASSLVFVLASGILLFYMRTRADRVTQAS